MFTANSALEALDRLGAPAVEPLIAALKDPAAPTHKPLVWYKGFLYQTARWKTARGVVVGVGFHVNIRTRRSNRRKEALRSPRIATNWELIYE